MPSTISYLMSPPQFPLPPTPPPKDTPIPKVKRRKPKANAVEEGACLNGRSDAMASAVERRKRANLPKGGGDDDEKSISTSNSRRRAKDLKPVTAPLPTLTAARTSASTNGSRDSYRSLYKHLDDGPPPTESPTEPYTMTKKAKPNTPKLEARNEFEDVKTLDFREMLKSMDYEADEDAHTATPVSTMDWSRDDAQPRKQPGIRSMMKNWKRNSDESDDYEMVSGRPGSEDIPQPHASIKIQGSEHCGDAPNPGTVNVGQLPGVSAIWSEDSAPVALNRARTFDEQRFGKSATPVMLDRAGTFDQRYDSNHVRLEPYAERWKEKFAQSQSKKHAQAQTVTGATTASAQVYALNVNPYASGKPLHLPSKPSSLRHASSMDVRARGDGDPFAGLHSRAPPSTTTDDTYTSPQLEITPWSFQSPCKVATAKQISTPDVVREFVDRYPPPPIPNTPTRSAGRSLRSIKSDYSIRTSATGERLAPEIASPRRATEVEITNPDDSPGLYIAKAVSPGFPSSPLHQDWEPAIQQAVDKFKAQIMVERAEEKRRVQEDKGERKLSSRDRRKAEHEAMKKTGERMIARASLFGYTPNIDWAAMTAEEVRIYGWAIDQEISKGDSRKLVKKLFKHVGKDKAKAQVANHAYLTRHKKMADHVLKAKLEGQLDDAKQAEIDSNGREAEEQIGHAIQALHEGRADEAAAHMERVLSTPDIGIPRMVESPEPERPADGRHAFLDRGLDEDTEYGDAHSERLRAYETLCAAGSETPKSSMEQPLGLGISNFDGPATLTTPAPGARLSIAQSVDYAASDYSTLIDDNTSTYAATPTSRLQSYVPLSPFGEEPLKVARSSAAPVDPHGRPIFKVKRNESFMRKLVEQRVKRARKVVGDHPAMRRDDDTHSPSTTPVTIDDIWTFDEFNDGKETTSNGVAARSLTLRGDNNGVSHAWKIPHNTADTRSPPNLALDAPSGSRRSVFDWSEDDEGYDTGSLVQQQFIGNTDEIGTSSLSSLEYHSRLSHISELMELKYPGSPEPEQALVDDVEYVDNPDYDPSLSTGVGGNEKEVAEMDDVPRQQACNIDIDIDIDDAIESWTSMPPKPLGLGKGVTQIARVRDLTAVRQEVGLPGLKLQQDTSRPKHPSHAFEWDTEKVMCFGAHTTLTELPKMECILPGKEVSMQEQLGQATGLFTPQPMEPASPKQKLQRCDRCLKFCCLFAENLLTSSIHARSKEEVKVRTEAEEKVLKLQQFYPNGLEVYDTFLTCSECSRVVCPKCAKMCRDGVCREVMCRDCSKEARGRCCNHSSRSPREMR